MIRGLWFRRLCFAGGIALVALVALLPWWRHHGYLRDFYDYGLVMSGVGRIDAGERPYRDFVTPIQTGTFLFNRWAEHAGDGTYQAMTRGAAVLIALASLGLAMIFARRWPAWIALAAAGALTVMSAAQHTIVWHNSVGALCLVAVAWGAALAPLLRRRDWPWHLLVAAMLFVGGINKLNAQLVALAVAAAWALRAVARGEGSFVRLVSTLACWLGAGVVAPVVFELAWTHADFATWWHNVVAMPFSSRAGDFGEALHAKFYFQTHHIYYGKLTIPWLGALGVAASAWFGVVAWRAARSNGDRIWAVAAALFACGAGAGLLATNYEIAWVALAAWLGLVAALWAGFVLPARGGAFIAGVVAPLLLVGTAAWESAWRGQRSQFGYSLAPRSSYVDAGTLSPQFNYLRGTRVPPEIGTTMQEALHTRGQIPEVFRARIFYGPGLEWLERVWPTAKVRGLPLWLHLGTSYGADEEEKLAQQFLPGGAYEYIFVSEARDHWGARLGPEIRRRFLKERIGPSWFLYRALPPGVVSADPLEFLRQFGGNTDSTQMLSLARPFALSDGRRFLGVLSGTGSLTLRAPAYRLRAEAVIRRRDVALAGPVRVHFGAFAMVGEHLYERGTFDAELPAGDQEKTFPTNIDPGGVPMLFTVTVPPELSGRIEAGWRGPQLLHTVDGPEAPPLLASGAHPYFRVGPTFAAALLPTGAAELPVFARLAGAQTSGVNLAPGGEVWVRLKGGFPSMNIRAQPVGELVPGAQPVVRVIYYKNGRLDIMAQDAIRSPDAVNIHAWSAEADGWIGVLLDPNPSVPSINVRFTELRHD